MDSIEPETPAVLEDRRHASEEDAEHDESPLSYQSLEERTNALARAQKEETYRTALHKEEEEEENYDTYDSLTMNAKVASSTSSPLSSLEETDTKPESHHTPPSNPPSSQRGSKQPPLSDRRSSKSGTALRRGKWTVEEEAYVARVIQDFNAGFLNAPAGTTLRTFLSEKLKCDPMRITKKFTGDACIGKRVFHPAVRTAHNSATIDTAQVRRGGGYNGESVRNIGSMILCFSHALCL